MLLTVLIFLIGLTTVVLDTINDKCRLVEKGLNMLECVPVVGMLSSALRVKIAYVQAMVGLASFAVGSIGFVAGMCLRSQKWQKRFKSVLLFGVEHQIHGALNILRGYAVLMLGAGTFGWGNLFMLIPNNFNEEPFGPYFYHYRKGAGGPKLDMPILC
ncbi:hypothetical protein [Parachlamydia sp. AcF125]|uniref:hypothetical protein n=1 Tax=Parachlamydia sp. AcF125 TaxID=2795736 RepID=UPI001BD902FF|nr:hypothetical protein [Parachlamydia sp. AcF125]MBS4167995.1 hypothetical protein [Parachlamydia sp. AcF125]